MTYTLNQLHIFLKIVQSKSITKASEALHLTQPAVSIQLKNFQEQFEIPLTEVVGRKIYITDFGMEIAAAAENILNQVYAINYKTSAYKGLLTGKLKISVVSTGKYVMPFFLSDFIHEHSDIELLMDVTNKTKVIESLENNEVDFALVSILPGKLEIEQLDLIPNRLYLVGHANNNFDGNIKTKDFFKNQPLIFREKGSDTRQTMENFFDQNKVSVSKKIELTSNEAVKQALLAGLGYSIMPIIGIKNELQNKELQLIPVIGLPINSTWSLIWLKGKKHSHASKAFIKFLEENKAKIVKERFSWYEHY
jgi:DNA-binding transcriptional LysR family regulator